MLLKIEKKIAFSNILSSGTFLNDYAQDPTAFSGFLHFGPHQIEEKISSLNNQFFPYRKELVDYLYTRHQNLKAPGETLQNIKALADSRTLVVMTGQQPGLLTGPVYTIYKTISCLRQAKLIEKITGLPCVPMFWIASEDHDLEEVTSIFLPQILPEPGGNCYKKLSIHPKRGHFKQPAGLLPLQEKYLGPFIQELKNTLAPFAYAQDIDCIMQIIQKTLHDSSTLGEWFSRLILTFFGSSGLVLIEPDRAEIKRLALPVWEKVLSGPLALVDLVDKAGQRLEQCGYHRQITINPGQCPFFLYENKRRERVIWDGQVFRTQNQSYSCEQLQDIIQVNPEMFSPNVYLRPIFSEFLFPTLIYSGGPGEMGYFAQIRSVYEYFGLKMPIVIPRLSITLKEEKSRLSSGSSDIESMGRSLDILQDPYPQERKLNIFYLLSRYGCDFLTALRGLTIENHSLYIEDYFSHYQVTIYSDKSGEKV